MTVLDRLHAADPARDHSPPPDELLLQRLLGEPRQAPRRRLPVRRLAAVAAAAVIAGVVVASGGSPSPDLAARAYAQTSAAEQILYVRTRSEGTQTSPRGRTHNDIVAEYWTYEGRVFYRVVTQTPGRPAIRFELAAAPDGSVRTRRDDEAWSASGASPDTEALRRGFVAEFRRYYERGQLETATDATFAGRNAKRYVVTQDHPGRAEYYVDAETAEPLGAIYVTRFSIRPNGPLVGEQRNVQTVEKISHLEPTPENLAKLT
ncbi:MAG TPA: hypothetical protein VFZ89_17425 [Solirubrobacteraceae bacterium]